VPKRWAEDPRLGSWVSRQRTGKKKLDRGEPSNGGAGGASLGMTAERVARLMALGFEWELLAAWPHHIAAMNQPHRISDI
jgi:hypothetical protein